MKSIINIIHACFIKLLEYFTGIFQKNKKHETINTKNSSLFPPANKLPILTIELVPEPCWYFNLRYVLPKVQWDQLRNATYLRAGHRCKVCKKQSSESLECHEVWYYDDVKKIQILKELIALCKNCHRVKHIGLANVQGYGKKALKHLRKVNGMTLEEANNYIDDCFMLWKFRGSFSWKIELSWLNTQGLSIPHAPQDSTPLRMEPLRINFVMSSQSYPDAGLSQPSEVWSTLYPFCTDDSAVAVELVLHIPQNLSNDPALAQELVTRFIEQYLILDDLYFQVNIILPNPLSVQFEAEKQCLGLCHAHILVSLLSIMPGKRFKISKIGLELLLCPRIIGHSSGEYLVQNDIITRWLTKSQLEEVWKQNAGNINILHQTCSKKS